MSRRKMQPTPPVGQSLFGSLSLLGGLLGVFLILVQGILRLQSAFAGSHRVESFLGYWLTRAQIGVAVIALVLALLSFPFSSKKQRNAVLGLVLGAVVVTAWVLFQNYRY